MKKIKNLQQNITRAAFGIITVLLIALSGSALALTDESGQTTDKTRPKTTQSAPEVKKTDRPGAAKLRLEGDKLKACQNRERVINNTLDRIAQRGDKRLEVYNKIFQRVQDFYVRKGLSVANYDQLVAEANTKKTAAQTTVDGISDKQVDFTCDGTDPKGIAVGFKVDLQTQIKVLHDYQQSIKNLIVAVKTAVSASMPDKSASGPGVQ